MEISGKIAAILSIKGSQVWSLPPSASVYDAIAMMAEKKVGSLLVMQKEKLLGIISERDYARKVILCGRSSHDTPVSDIMTSPVMTVSPSHTVAECMRLVTDQRIRHLPVLDQEKVVGMVSIGDLIKWVITEQEETIRHLESFITGTHTYRS
jgi:CBS domain-containing protein